MNGMDLAGLDRDALIALVRNQAALIEALRRDRGPEAVRQAAGRPLLQGHAEAGPQEARPQARPGLVQDPRSPRPRGAARGPPAARERSRRGRASCGRCPGRRPAPTSSARSPASCSRSLEGLARAVISYPQIQRRRLPGPVHGGRLPGPAQVRRLAPEKARGRDREVPDEGSLRDATGPERKRCPCCSSSAQAMAALVT